MYYCDPTLIRATMQSHRRMELVAGGLPSGTRLRRISVEQGTEHIGAVAQSGHVWLGLALPGVVVTCFVTGTLSATPALADPPDARRPAGGAGRQGASDKTSDN